MKRSLLVLLGYMATMQGSYFNPPLTFQEGMETSLTPSERKMINESSLKVLLLEAQDALRNKQLLQAKKYISGMFEKLVKIERENPYNMESVRRSLNTALSAIGAAQKEIGSKQEQKINEAGRALQAAFSALPANV